jgi:DNA-directed RNA polymerase beta subunit
MVKSKKAEVDETKVAAEKNTTKKPSKAKVVENYDLPTWDILDAFFMQGGDTDCTNNIVRHQIESFNEFIDKQLIQIIQGFNPIQVCHNYNQEIGNFKYKIFLNILKPSLAKPMYQMTDGTQMLMTPHLARMNNLTYASNLYVDIHVITDVINDDNVTERKETTLTGVCIGKIPIMVRSKACVLSQMPGIAEGEGDHECRYDYGGYFLINGNEKVVISQDRISENKTLVFAPNGNGDGLYAEIRSMPDGMFLPPKTTSLHLSGKSNHMGNIIRLSASFLRAEVPLFVMFRALGIESDKEIYAHIVLDLDAPKQQRMLTQLAACSEDACDIHTQKDALTCLLKILGTTGTPKEFLDQPERAFDILKNTIKNDFLSHTGPSFKKKALYLGYMVRKLLSIHLGYLDFDNRDSYLHKRIDTPGILFSNLFRQCYGKLIKEVRNLVVRELNLWRASTNVPLQLINQNNVHRFFKQGLIETGLRYALSTGNWGVKSIGSFQNIRQGVAQVLNRMSYLSTLSHLRRINTPMEKNGKLVQPRKLENSQYGMICPSECFDPETPILLWNGNIVKAQDIIVGDYLIDDNGHSIKVKSTCSGYKTMYEIIPTKKNFMSYTVTDNHILTLKVRKYKSVRNHRGNKEFMWFDKKTLSYNYKDFKDENELQVFESSLDNDDVIDITIEKYLSLPNNVQKNLYTFKSSGIHWESKEVALDPYILGMWLGDGLSCGYGFVTADKELLDKWIEWGVDNDATIKKGIKYKYWISSTINNTQTGIACNKSEKAPLKKLLAKYNLVKNKHIPLDYLVNDRKTRLAVLAGLIDTDGNVRANGHEIRITQGEPNYKIIYDTEFLARSLGFSCHVNEGICSYTVNGGKRHKPYKELSITGQYLYEIPTVLPRKKLNTFDNPTSEKRGSSFLQSSFTLIQKDVQPFVGWQVEGSGRFLLGDMSVVHNTPEGAAVGLVKNIALSTHITVNVSSAFVRETLMELGTELYGDHITDSLAFLKRMGADNSVHIMMNGDIIGFHTEPEQLYTQLKHLKRYGSIPPTTAIVWDVQKSLISLSTEAGRMLRPLYVVDPAESDDTAHFPQLRLFNILRKTGMSWKEFHAHFTSFQSFVAPMIDDTGEGFIEYMDVDEIDKAMVAMLPAHLKRTIKGTTLPPKFTHCEIEPSLLNGVLAANIPFMDHNQAPRNCYQCLNSDELVLLTSGEARAIKDIAVGDNVHCFNLHNGNLEPTKVIHQYSQLANKPMRHIFTMSGRRIIATNDHKFQTTEGWKAETDFNGATQLFIHPYPVSYPHTFKIDSTHSQDTGTDTHIIINDSMIYKTIVSELQTYGLADINALHPKLPIIARLAGYMHACNPLKFPSQLDEARFNEDIRSLGFVDGAQDRSFAVFMSGLDAIMQLPYWVAHGTQLVQREYINGIFGGYINSGFKSVMTILSEDIITIVSQFANISILSSSKLAMMNTFTFAYSQEYTMQEMKSAEYERYVQYMQSGGNSVSIITKADWDLQIKIQGDMLIMPIHRVVEMKTCMVTDITVESDHHSFIGGDGFAVSNSAMGKQAVGIYMSNFNNRIDTMAHVLHYPQKPLVRTKLSKYTNSIALPTGINAIVAIMTHTGFNQEDSVMLNKSAIDRGLFTSTYYKSYRDQCSKNHSTGEEEIFTKPVIEVSASGKMKPFNYDKLGPDGFIPKNVYVDSHDILVGKVMPQKVQSVISERDTSLQVKGNDDGHVDLNYQGINGDGYKFCKIRMRKYRKPQIGDKLASRSAQKGTIGMVYRHQDMPFTKDGISPDIIMNPHAIPSRMTIGQLMECIMGKACCHIGAAGDSTPFTDCSVESIANILGKSGYERYGNEILYNGRTGEQMKTEIFIGPTYYQRLKHMVADKSHCLTMDHEVLTSNGWKFFPDITIDDHVATLKDGNLVYDKPTALLHFPEYEGKMYHISNQAIDLDVTDNHRMWVSRCHTRKRIWSEYHMEKAEEIMGKLVRYKKDADWQQPDYQFILPKFGTGKRHQPDKLVNMNAWLTFFGIWIAEGWTTTYETDTRLTERVQICDCKQRVKDALYPALKKLDYNYDDYGDKTTITNKQLYHYMQTYSVGAPNKYLPEWVWKLSANQCKLLMESMILGDGSYKPNGCLVYYTSSIKLADDVMRLCLHAGWTSMKHLHSKAGNTTIIKGRQIVSQHDMLRLSIIKKRVNPTVNHGHTYEQKIQEEFMYNFKGPVFCLQVPSEVFMVRKNGKSVWTGNSRGSNGPIVLLTRQPAEGRARNGGLRFGEMERDAIVAHGASAFLKERMLDVSDNFRVFICRQCGLICTANPEKNIYKCSTCKNNADITQVRIPYAMKLLIQELMTMGVAPRITV